MLMMLSSFLKMGFYRICCNPISVEGQHHLFHQAMHLPDIVWPGVGLHEIERL